ncbi:MAG: hypothetical protein V2A66_07000 [Pseudomonadota bacterium]
MKAKAAAVLLVAVAMVVTSAPSFAKEKKENLNSRIENLQKQVDDLKDQQEKEKQDKGEKKTSVGAKFPVDFYGFVAAQLFLGTARTQMYGGLNSVAAQSRVIDKATATGGRHTWFGATPQNSRVGFDWKGSKVSDKLSMGGIFEMDFVNVLNQTSYGTSPIPRIRHLYLDLFSDRWSLIAGQNWDIFSPLNTASLSLGGNMWFLGNQGFRRPQVRLTYNAPLDDTNKLKVAISANLPTNTDDLVSSTGANSGMPMGEALAQYNRKMKSGDFIAALSGFFGANSVNSSYDKMAGVAGSLSIPFHKFLKLSGEFQYGQDPGVFLSYVNATGNQFKNWSVAAWGQITSQWHEKFDTAVGYGIDKMGYSKIAAGNVNKNQMFFANFRFFPVKPFYFGIEYEYLKTAYKGHGTSTANVIFSNLVYTF